jgi:hypothetical protein
MASPEIRTVVVVAIAVDVASGGDVERAPLCMRMIEVMVHPLTTFRMSVFSMM